MILGSALCKIYASVSLWVGSTTWTSASSTCSRHVSLRGPTHVHKYAVFGYAVVLSHLGYGRRRPWYFLKHIIKDTMNYVNAPGLPWEAEGRWPWRAPRRAFGSALAAGCSAPTVYRMMSPVRRETYALVLRMALGRSQSKESWAQTRPRTGGEVGPCQSNRALPPTTPAAAAGEIPPRDIRAPTKETVGTVQGTALSGPLRGTFQHCPAPCEVRGMRSCWWTSPTACRRRVYFYFGFDDALLTGFCPSLCSASPYLLPSPVQFSLNCHGRCEPDHGAKHLQRSTSTRGRRLPARTR